MLKGNNGLLLAKNSNLNNNLFDKYISVDEEPNIQKSLKRGLNLKFADDPAPTELFEMLASI